MKLTPVLPGWLSVVVLSMTTTPALFAATRTDATSDTKVAAVAADEEIASLRAQIASLQKRLEDLERKRSKDTPVTKTDPSICANLATAHRRAIKENKPLLLWVGQPARAVPGCVSVHLERYQRAHSPGVVVGMPDDDGEVTRVADLSGAPSDREIKAKAVLPTPEPQAAPSYQFAPQAYAGGFGGFGGFGGGSGGGC
jgi:hypothetical protein